MKLREALKKVVTKKELEIAPSGFDIVGDIAIVEIPKGLEKKEKKIGKTVLCLHKNILVVVKKVSKHSGTYRLQRYKILAGERRKTTLHKESKTRLRLHLEKTYFSARSGSERLRIAKLVKRGESVLVMFSGIAPFPLVIAKNAEPSYIIGIELNPEAHRLAEENVRLNKEEQRIALIEGNVKTVIPTVTKPFDRIIMPLPKDAELFFKDALKVSKKGTTIHLYCFGREEDIKKIKKELRQQSTKKLRFLRVVKAGDYSPGVYRLCFDIRLLE